MSRKTVKYTHTAFLLRVSEGQIGALKALPFICMCMILCETVKHTYLSARYI